MDRTEFTQPALFAVEVALWRLVESLGVRADFLIGHSVGEMVAAHVAGVFSLADACRLVAARGRLMGALPEGGAMVAVQVSEREAREAIGGFADRVSLAAVNGPRAVVISGDADAVAALESRFAQQGVRAKRLRVSHAFHSPRMEPMLGEFERVVGEVAFGSPRLPIVSNLTGEVLTGEQACSVEYWVSLVREAVRFADGVAALERAGVSHFLELGPDGVLSAMARACLSEELEPGALSVSALRAGRSEASSLVGFLAEVDAAGVGVDWGELFAGARRVPLPTYAFRRQRFWLSPGGGAGDARSLGLTADEHPLLAAMVVLPDDGAVFTGRLSLDTHAWLADHVVLGAVLLPGTAFVELALHAAERLDCEVVEELTLSAPLVLDEHGAVQIQVVVSGPGQDGGREFSVHSRPEWSSSVEPAEWTRHASGVLAVDAPVAEPESFGMVRGRRWGLSRLMWSFCMTGWRRLGMIMGRCFRGWSGLACGW